MIAMALSCQPKLLIADEPTTALDVTIQAQILELLRKLQAESGMSILLITHDLGVVAENADTVAVMYASRVVEFARVEDLFDRPEHPYTVGLFRSMPKLGGGAAAAGDDRRERAQPGRLPVRVQVPPPVPPDPRAGRGRRRRRRRRPGDGRRRVGDRHAAVRRRPSRTCGRSATSTGPPATTPTGTRPGPSQSPGPPTAARSLPSPWASRRRRERRPQAGARRL